MTAQAKGPPAATGHEATAAPQESAPTDRPVTESRRRALARLGLAGLAAYSAPSVLRIDRTARAAILPPECEPPPDFPPGFPPICP